MKLGPIQNTHFSVKKGTVAETVVTKGVPCEEATPCGFREFNTMEEKSTIKSHAFEPPSTTIPQKIYINK